MNLKKHKLQIQKKQYSIKWLNQIAQVIKRMYHTEDSQFWDTFSGEARLKCCDCKDDENIDEKDEDENKEEQREKEMSSKDLRSETDRDEINTNNKSEL